MALTVFCVASMFFSSMASNVYLASNVYFEEAMLFGSSFGSMEGADHTVVETFSELRNDSLASGIERPEWCKNETSLTWAQKKQRMQQQNTLRWAKQEAAKLEEDNKTIPAWMQKMVQDDANRGKMKWAVQEAKRLSSEGKEVPEWMADMVKEDAKWANRWAACKAAELKESGEEVPQWMDDNARRGIMEYADEKSNELQEQIDELEEAKTKEDALVLTKGDLKMAWQRMLAGTKTARVRSVEQQFHVLEEAMAELSEAERYGDQTKTRMVHLAKNVLSAYELLGRVMEHHSAALLSGM